MRTIATVFITIAVAAAAETAPGAAVGLGIYIADGTYSDALDPNLPGQLRVVDDGRGRYLQELDIVQGAPSSDALGIAPVEAAGAFAQLDWSGVHQVPCHPDGGMEDWRLEIDGAHYMRSWCYRGAAWMEGASMILVSPRNSAGGEVGAPILDVAGDVVGDFWEKRFVARVVAHNCAAVGDCSGASVRAEALLQLRGNLSPQLNARIIRGNATSIEVWLSTCGQWFRMAATALGHDALGTVGYGLRAQLSRETPYPARGFFVPGEQVTFRVAYTDGDGDRLHAAGQLPSYGAALFGDPVTNGLRYLTFTDDPVLYWAHKNTQSDMTFTVAGPLDRMTTIGSAPITITEAFLPQIPTATAAADGWSGAVQIFPPTSLVFPCLFSLVTGTPAAECFQPVADTFTITVPADASPGTWLATVKARRVWEGEPVQAAASTKFQVGRVVPTGFTPHLTGCARCHVGPSSLAIVGHGFDVGNHERPECLSCHTSGYSSWFEPDAGFDKRMTFVHLLSRRFFSMGGRPADVTW